MDLTILLISAFIMGCIAAIPAGPVQIEVIRRSITGHLKPSFMVILGAFLVDIFYGIIAFWGIAPFLEEKKVMALFWLAGGLILTVIGVLTVKHSLKQQEINYNTTYLKKKRWALLGGISLSVTNPVMILWWLSSLRIFRDLGLIKDFTPDIAAAFLIAGSLGLAAYLLGLSLFIHWAKKFISANRIRQMNIAFGIFLLMLAAYFIYTSAGNLLNLS